MSRKGDGERRRAREATSGGAPWEAAAVTSTSTARESFSSISIVTTALPASLSAMVKEKEPKLSFENLEKELEQDDSVKVAGIDIDGTLRGKLMSKKKFLGIAKDGFGFCSVIFGWDMHDRTYFKELKISNADNGYRDIIAVPDLSSFRRIPWEDNVPFFLISFMDPDTGGPISACSRGLLKTAADKLEKKGMWAMAGGESEYM